jgi:hypothetical protein
MTHTLSYVSVFANLTIHIFRVFRQVCASVGADLARTRKTILGAHQQNLETESEGKQNFSFSAKLRFLQSFHLRHNIDPLHQLHQFNIARITPIAH